MQLPNISEGFSRFEQRRPAPPLVGAEAAVAVLPAEDEVGSRLAARPPQPLVRRPAHRCARAARTAASASAVQSLTGQRCCPSREAPAAEDRIALFDLATGNLAVFLRAHQEVVGAASRAADGAARPVPPIPPRSRRRCPRRRARPGEADARRAHRSSASSRRRQARLDHGVARVVRPEREAVEHAVHRRKRLEIAGALLVADAREAARERASAQRAAAGAIALAGARRPASRPRLCARHRSARRRGRSPRRHGDARQSRLARRASGTARGAAPP